MKKLLLLVTTLALLSLGLVGCGQKAADNSAATGANVQKSALKVALDASYRPMEWEENGQVTGFDADLITAIAKEMGRTVELQNIGWDDIFDKLYAKQYDIIISSVSINEERKQTMAFSDPYFESTSSILTRTSTNVKSAKDLSGKKVAVQEGTTIEDLINKNIAGVELKKFKSATDALSSFQNNEVDAVVADEPVVLDYVKQNKNPEYTVVDDKAFFGQDQFGIAANKDNASLISEVNAALAKLKSNGEYQKVYDKYFK